MSQLAHSDQTILFCFPYSGASASLFRAWVNKIPSIAVCPVELPGHGLRISEPLVTSLPELVEITASAIFPYIHQPFAFFGHSMGALLSFELARFIRDRCQKEPTHLFVSGHDAPHLNNQHPVIHDLPENAFIEKIRQMNGTDDAFFKCQELQEVFIPILRADFTVCGTYQYQPCEPLSCPITAMGGLNDPDVPRSALEAWRDYTTSAFKVRMFQGDHFYLKNDNINLTLLEILARELGSGSTPGYRAAY